MPGCKSFSSSKSGVLLPLTKLFNTSPLRDEIVITSDHGETIPIIDEKLGSVPNIQSAMKKGKEKFPILEPVGLK